MEARARESWRDFETEVAAWCPNAAVAAEAEASTNPQSRLSQLDSQAVLL
jgi:hypothetical protein